MSLPHELHGLARVCCAGETPTEVAEAEVHAPAGDTFTKIIITNEGAGYITPPLVVLDKDVSGCTGFRLTAKTGVLKIWEPSGGDGYTVRVWLRPGRW